ncbi:MAG: ANTAR domain-containing protein [Alphaproteobacteria bacterium]|nr:ANTAR domain-containing protein [Alphaproteobacteria bacterium]MDE2267091.1 ANTAR domain-containing protein [Alphaproteobacteria bacterium]MDE2499121.1 ANTAR domain-containing protein [Alphaproteobacteria bacterium]
MKVLVADEMDERAEALMRHLLEAGVEQVVRVAANERLIEAVKCHAPDVLIVDMSRADRDSLEPIREVTASDPKPIVMFTDCNDHAFMEDAIIAGVSSYNVRGTSLPEVKPIVQAAVAIFRRYQKVAGDLQIAETRLDEHAMVQQAKTQLMRERNISEPQAYKWLRERAMDRGKRIAEIARELLASRKQD